jgi:hypothetical protein
VGAGIDAAAEPPFDTLEAFQRLKAGGFTDEQATALVDVICAAHGYYREPWKTWRESREP